MAQDDSAARGRSNHIALDHVAKTNIPGYLAAARQFSLYGSFRAGWNGLNVFDGKTAEAFLEDKLESIAGAFDMNVETGRSVTLEVVLAFGVMAVLADRELRETEYINAKIEREATDPPGVEW